MDIFLLNHLITEMAQVLVGHRPGRVWQVGLTDLIVDFNLRDGRWLHISTDPVRLGLYLSQRGPREMRGATRTDTGFVSLWRKHLEGLKLIGIEPLGYDRVVRFSFGDGEGERRRVVVALTGRTANMYLLAGNELLAELREREGPTATYSDPPPPTDRLDPLNCPPDVISSLLLDAREPVSSRSARHLLGFTPLLGKELEARIQQRNSFPLAWDSIVADLAATIPEPTIYANPPLDQLRQQPGIDEIELILSPFRLRHLRPELQSHFDRVNEAADIYFSLLQDRRWLVGMRHRLGSHLNSKLKKIGTLLVNLSREEAKYSGVEAWQRQGELLLANIHEAVKTEQGHWLVVDYFDPEQRLIEIDAEEFGTVKETAEHYFRMARKGRHSRESIAGRRPLVIAERQSIEADLARLLLVTRLDQLLPLADKYGLKNEPSEGRKVPSDRGRTARATEQPVPGTRRYRSSDGYEILVGRTDRDNDHLTLRVAKSSDLWFHAADYPGSHVILRNPKRQEVPHHSIVQAAQLAAKFSQARELPKVAVNYCEKKFVTKPKGFAPGQVRLASFRTVLVEPGETVERT